MRILSLFTNPCTPLRRAGVGLCLLAMPAMALTLPLPALAITDLPCQNGVCQPNQNNENYEQVAGLGSIVSPLLKGIFSLANYALQLYMSVQSGGADKGVGVQASLAKAMELGVNAQVKAGRFNERDRKLADAMLNSAKGAVGNSLANKKTILLQCHNMAANRITNNLVKSQADIFATNEQVISAATDALLLGTARTASTNAAISSPQQYAAVMASATAKTRILYGAAGSQKIRVQDPITGVCVDKNSEIIAAQTAGLMPWKTNFCKKSDADKAFNMAQDQFLAGTLYNCGPRPAINKAIPNDTPQAIQVNACAAQGIAAKFRPDYFTGIDKIEDLANYKLVPEIYAQADSILRKPGNEKMFGLDGLSGNHLDDVIKGILRSTYHAAEFEDKTGPEKFAMTNADLNRLTNFVIDHMKMDAPTNATNTMGTAS